MLVLYRKKKEWIQIGDDILVTVVAIRGNTVRLGTLAPSSVSVVRAELLDDPSSVHSGGKEGFLVLSRRKDEAIVMGVITLKVVEIRGNGVRLGIEAPKDIPVRRVQRAAA